MNFRVSWFFPSIWLFWFYFCYCLITAEAAFKQNQKTEHDMYGLKHQIIFCIMIITFIIYWLFVMVYIYKHVYLYVYLYVYIYFRCKARILVVHSFPSARFRKLRIHQNGDTRREGPKSASRIRTRKSNLGWGAAGPGCTLHCYMSFECKRVIYCEGQYYSPYSASIWWHCAWLQDKD